MNNNMKKIILYKEKTIESNFCVLKKIGFRERNLRKLEISKYFAMETLGYVKLLFLTFPACF